MMGLRRIPSRGRSSAQRPAVVAPKTTTKEQCEAEVKEYRALEPDKLLRDSTGGAYRIEYTCLPDTEDPRGPKTK
jgi:hypothetical protein